MRMLKLPLAVMVAGLIFAGCSSSDDDDLPPTDGRDVITLQYFESVLKNDLAIPFGSSDAHVEHYDGLDGSAVDIDTVLVTQADNAATGDLFSFAYDGVLLETLPVGTVEAFYMDMDQGATGFEFDFIKANYLLVNASTADETPDISLWKYSLMDRKWEAVGFPVVEQYYQFEFVSLGFKAVVVPDTTHADEILNKKDVEAILALQSFENGHVNQLISTSAKTRNFTMDTPIR